MKRTKLQFIVIAVLIIGSFGISSTIGAAGKAKIKDIVQKKSGIAAKDLGGQKQTQIKVTFVELGSVNCMPCKMMQPVMKEIEAEYGDQVKVIFYDVWSKDGSPYGKKYKIRAIPTQVFLDKDGKEFYRYQGFFPKEEIVKVLQKQGVK